nr:hypothetical protein [Tanacetum cinerariifolium]
MLDITSPIDTNEDFYQLLLLLRESDPSTFFGWMQNKLNGGQGHKTSNTATSANRYGDCSGFYFFENLCQGFIAIGFGNAWAGGICHVSVCVVAMGILCMVQALVFAASVIPGIDVAFKGDALQSRTLVYGFTALRLIYYPRIGSCTCYCWRKDDGSNRCKCSIRCSVELLMKRLLRFACFVVYRLPLDDLNKQNCSDFVPIDQTTHEADERTLFVVGELISSLHTEMGLWFAGLSALDLKVVDGDFEGNCGYIRAGSYTT